LAYELHKLVLIYIKIHDCLQLQQIIMLYSPWWLVILPFLFFTCIAWQHLK